MVGKTKHSLTYLTTCLVAVVLFFASCGEGSQESALSSGVIDYEITYPFPPEDQYLARILPTTLTLTYSPKHTKTEVSLSMGMIKMYYLANNEKKELSEYVKFMTNKYANTFTPEEFNQFKANYPKHTIEFTNDTKLIAGYTCKKAVVTYPDKNNYQFNLYYTDELNMNDFNWWTPFSEIKGVLMEYEVERYNILMHLTVAKITPAVHDENEFKIPSEYNMVDRSEMENMHATFEELNQ